MGFPITWTSAFMQAALEALIAAGSSSIGVLGAARCGLGQNVITPGPGTEWADFDEGGYTGYAEPAVIVWSAYINETDGSKTCLSPEQLFRCTGSSSVTMNSFFVNDGAGIDSVTHMGSTSTTIYGSGQLVPGKSFSAVGDGFGLTIAWNSGVATANCEATSTS